MGILTDQHTKAAANMCPAVDNLVADEAVVQPPCQRLALQEMLQTLIDASPVAQQSFDWAEQQALPIIVSHEPLHADACGAYRGHDKCVVLPPSFAQEDPLELLDTLVHEIRHAWQDAAGLFETAEQRLFAPSTWIFLHTSLMEADATAHGKCAYFQANGRARKKGYDTNEVLQKIFVQWFDISALDYFKYDLKNLRELHDRCKKGASALRISQADYMKDFFEEQAGPDIFSPLFLQKLGRTYTGKNYMSAGFAAAVRRERLSHERARCAFGAASKGLHRQVVAFDRAQARVVKSLQLARRVAHSGYKAA